MTIDDFAKRNRKHFFSLFTILSIILFLSLAYLTRDYSRNLSLAFITSTLLFVTNILFNKKKVFRYEILRHFIVYPLFLTFSYYIFDIILKALTNV